MFSVATARGESDARAARWTIQPAGEQVFDLLTGATSLPDGGTIVDAVTGWVLVADVVRFVEGVSIEAEEVRADVLGGVVEAARLDIDVASNAAMVTGGLTFTTPGLVLEAASASLLLDQQLARFDGPRGSQPVLEAATLYLDVTTGDAVLVGPYRFVQGIVTFRDEADDARLVLQTVQLDDGSIAYQASNEVEELVWERFAPVR